MQTKFLTFLIITISCIAYCYASDIVFGTITGEDILIQRTTVKQRFRPGRVVTRDEVFTTAAGTTIQGIKVIDHKDVKDSTVVISAGALGTTTVTLTFTSKRGASIKASVEVYRAP